MKSDFTSSNNVGGLVIHLLTALLAGAVLKRKSPSYQPPAFIASDFQDGNLGLSDGQKIIDALIENATRTSPMQSHL